MRWTGGQWQVAGSAPEAYERVVVPAVFGAWAPILVELAHPRLGKRAPFPGGPFDHGKESRLTAVKV